ncbi:MAG TPA: hypothetical protein DEA08_04230 [Planctomycetes bacterium]|nr:hypothetical protein [Planctomycetota bacterium]
MADGLDPRVLANAEVYERAVAFQFLGILAAQSYLDGQETAQAVADRQFALSDRYYEQVRPRLSQGDEPRTATEGVPTVLNPTPGPFFGGEGL